MLPFDTVCRRSFPTCTLPRHFAVGAALPGGRRVGPGVFGRVAALGPGFSGIFACRIPGLLCFVPGLFAFFTPDTSRSVPANQHRWAGTQRAEAPVQLQAAGACSAFLRPPVGKQQDRLFASHTPQRPEPRGVGFTAATAVVHVPRRRVRRACNGGASLARRLPTGRPTGVVSGVSLSLVTPRRPW